MSTKIDVWIKDAKTQLSKPNIDVCVCQSYFVNSEILQAFRQCCVKNNLAVFISDAANAEPFPKAVVVVALDADAARKQFTTELVCGGVESFLEKIEENLCKVGSRPYTYLSILSLDAKQMHSFAIAAKKKFSGRIAFEEFPKHTSGSDVVQWRVVLLAEKLLDAVKKTSTQMVDESAAKIK